jgi:hypothetical protein
MATKGTDTLDPASLQALLGPRLTAEPAALIFQKGPEVVVFALLSRAQQWAETPAAATTPDPSAPAGQTPPDAKPTAKGRANPKGAKRGHPGHRRPTPTPSRPPRGSHPRRVSEVSGPDPALPFLADPRHRGYPRRHHTRGHRARDPSRLVSRVSRDGRTGRY